MKTTQQIALDASELREYRATHALSAQVLCALLDIDKTTLRRWESCALPVPRVVLLWMRLEKNPKINHTIP